MGNTLIFPISFALLAKFEAQRGGGPSPRAPCPAAHDSPQRLKGWHATEVRPPRNVTVQCQDALGYLRTLPSQAPRHCIYADPPYIFPGRSMNYYGTRRRGHVAFHSELRDALFASGLPFLVSINDVPEAWELYSRAGSITRLCSGKNSSKPELLVLRQGNPALTQEWPEQSCCHSRIEAAILG